MMECPRCGFIQPEDRYCANCGLDIPSYVAEPKPLLQRLIARSGFHVFLLLSLFAAIYLYIQRNQTPKSSGPPVTTAPQPLASAPKSTSATPPESPRSAPPPAPAPPQAAPVAPSVPARRAELVEQANTAGSVAAESTPTPAASAPSEANKETTTAAAKPPGQIEVAFYEIPRELLAQIQTDAKVHSESANSRVLTIANREKAQSLLNSARRLPGQRSFTVAGGASGIFNFAGVAQTNESPTGMFIDVSVVKVDGGQVELAIAGQIHLRHEPGPSGAVAGETQGRFESSLSLPSQGAIVLTNLLPHRGVPETLDQAFANTPLNVLNSPEFLVGETEMILWLTGR